MKAIWKGAISFGLVTIPVRVYTATEEKSVRFHQVHSADGGRIRYKRVCERCGEEVPAEEIASAYEQEKDRYVVMSDDELQRGAPATRSIDILSFVPLEEIDPIYWKKSYYLEPEPTGAKAYTLLRKALGDNGLVGLAKFTIRDKEHLATLRLRDKVFVLETMFWPDEIRAPAFDVLQQEPEVRAQEVKMARSLIESMTEGFDPAGYRDEYRARVLELITKKIQGEEITVVPEKATATVTDLMEALRASVEAVASGKGRAGGASQAKPGRGKKAG